MNNAYLKCKTQSQALLKNVSKATLMIFAQKKDWLIKYVTEIHSQSTHLVDYVEEKNTIERLACASELNRLISAYLTRDLTPFTSSFSHSS